MKAILKFVYDTENYDQVREVETIQHALDWKFALQDVDTAIRDKLKYDGNLSEDAFKALDEIRRLIHSTLNEKNLSLFN